MKQLIKIVTILVILLNCFTITCNASLDWDNIQTQAQGFIGTGKTEGQGYITTENLKSLIEPVSDILLTIGVVIVLVGILVIGIKYMVATPEEAAKLKTKLVGLAIAGVVIIGAYGIWKLAYDFFNGMTTTIIS